METLLTETTLCPCNSGLLAASCCLPILADHRRAETALALMRSRYTAFVLRHESHILASWHVKHRPKNLNFEDFPVKWLSLEINGCELGEKGDPQGMVDFTSTYVERGQLCRLRETSRFVREEGLWYYLSGDCQVSRSKIERNRPCPCGSAKKFKQCCLIATLP